MSSPAIDSQAENYTLDEDIHAAHITARYLLSVQSQLRFALTRTISRPGFEDASPRQALENTDEPGISMQF